MRLLLPGCCCLRSARVGGAASLPRLLATLLMLAVFVSVARSEKEANAEAAALDRKLMAEAKADSELMANLTYLSDIIGPRLTGSPALKRANEWAAEKMKSYGLSNVRLEPWELPIGWERGTARARISEPDNGRTITLASLGWSPGTNGKIEGDVVVVSARRPEELNAYKGKLKNAIVLRGPPSTVRPVTDLRSFFDRGGPGGSPSGSPSSSPSSPGKPDGKPEGKPEAKPEKPDAKPEKPEAKPDRPPGFDTRPGRFFGDPTFRREMAEFFKKEGVAATLVDSAKPHGLLTMSGGWSGRDRVSAPDAIPSLCVTHEHYSLLHRLATRPAPARTRLEIEVENKFVPGPIPVYNTVGEIPGSEKPDEFIVLGAHIDSWDLGQGTTDNGTGTAVVLETARILARCGVRPKRTIRFALFSGEEQGLHGSAAYVQRHKDEMAKTSLCLVHDTGTGKVVGLGLQGREALKPILEAELPALRELGVAEINLRGMGGSDHMSFDRAGIPGLMFQQDPAEYRLTHHSQSDTLDKARADELVQGAQVMAVIAMRVANLDQLLPREKGGRKPGPESPEKPGGKPPE